MYFIWVLDLFPELKFARKMCRWFQLSSRMIICLPGPHGHLSSEPQCFLTFDPCCRGTGMAFGTFPDHDVQQPISCQTLLQYSSSTSASCSVFNGCHLTANYILLMYSSTFWRFALCLRAKRLFVWKNKNGAWMNRKPCKKLYSSCRIN